ncbi:MAG: radical SAM protein [Candidatus Alcyoniella australis]|nr:radical SAM protein [Candidatus Alcyoniella australis]
MQVLLVQPQAHEGELFNLPGKEIPLSILSIATYLRSQGIDARVLDLTLEPAPRAALSLALSGEPSVVGVTSYTTNVALAHRVAQQVKAEQPQAVVVLGGFHASALPERTLEEFPAFDHAAVGEGEITLLETVQRVLAGEDPTGVLGLYSRGEGGVVFSGPRPLIEDLDSLPIVDRRLIQNERYVPDPGNYHHLPSTGVIYSRGCPMKCAYCSKSVFEDTVRFRSVENFIQELQLCGELHGITDFRLYDEGPTIRRHKMVALCEGILSRGLRVSWNCFSRVDTVNRELLQLMARAGCYHVIYGVESGHRPTQERISKVLDIEQVVQVCETTRKLGIECKANYIIGFPWEDEQAIRQTLALTRKAATDLVSINLFKPFPGSRLYNEMSAAGQIKDVPWEAYFTTSSTEVFQGKVSPQRLKRILKRAWYGYYFRPRMIVRRLRRLLSNPRRELTMNLTGIRVLLANLFR